MATNGLHPSEVTPRDMSGSRIKEMKPMMLASGYETVKGLVLKNNWITNIDRAALDNQNSLIELDLRNNHIKTLPRGIFSQRKFRLLYLANNSFSCDDTNLVGEIKDLINSMTDVKLETGASNLRVFDYEMLRCAEPAHMKGRKIVDVISELRGNKASFLGTAGAVTGLTSGVIAALLTLVIAAAIILVKRLKLDGKYRYNFLSSTDKGSMEQNQKESETVVDEQEQGKVVAQRLQKVRRQSQGYPAKENMESEDDT
ncbi:uncharacterized protein LOC116288574 [Actinia tenebrosa]|uniref:Uncharacterized protein LOC116288574 n=1 Tax=Actinia tenebrosa TaxID=6105 RepID=A0A6P8HF30_ACTTE|nr:uncharacterized protein LOC116288574 [Actinia tenebrosa]